jgi:predicted AAA+ superfamily ATPase
MYSRLLSTPQGKSFFLFGPRGTGKTTWIKTQFPRAVYLDLLEAAIFNQLLANPGRLESFIPNKFRDWIVIDEVQRVPELLNEVHRLIERDKLKFVLTGSSARKLRQGGVNLLAGRALTNFFHPLTVKELGADFNLDRSLRFGHLPSACTETDPQRFLQSYVKTYLEEEIKQEGLTRNISAFARFLETASFSQGSVLNTSAVAREAAVERKVVENYFEILEDLLIAYRLPVFSKKAKRRLVRHRKFYFFDAGLYRALRPAGPLDQPEEIAGAALETLFFQELLAINDYYQLGYKMFYYQTAAGKEVDFILYGPRGIKAFEVKHSAKISGTVLKGLRFFGREYPQACCRLIYRGKRQLRIGTVDIIPAEMAFKNLASLL